jgi:hypothetical protein
MKIFHRFVHWLHGSRMNEKSPEMPAPENAGPPLVQVPLTPRPEPFTDDDSPPGYKIRWHC